MNRASVILTVIAVATTAALIATFRSFRTCSDSTRPPVNLKGRMAPDFALESLDGRIVRLSDFQGKPVILSFCATTWLPCRPEMQWFEQMHRQFGPQGLEVLGIAMDNEDKKDIAEFADNLGVDYPILLGTQNVAESYGGVQTLPMTVYVGRDRKIIEKVFGVQGHDEIEDRVKKALRPAE